MTQQHGPQAEVSAAPVAVREPAAARDDDRERLRHSVQRSMVGVDHASVMGVELMAAILVWTGIGFLMDRWLGTTPWLLVVGGLIGNAAGIYLIWIRSGHMEAAERRADLARRDAAEQRYAQQRDAADRHDVEQRLMAGAPEGGPGDR